MSNDKTNASGTQEDIAYALKQYRAGNYDEVERVCSNLLALEPDRIDILNVLAALFWRLEKLDKAMDFYKNLARLEPNNPSHYISMGRISFVQTNSSECLEFYRKAYSLDRNSTATCFNLGVACAEFGYTEEAISLFERVLVIEPQNIGSGWNRAISLLVIGDLKRGFAEYEKYRWQHRREFFKAPDFFPEPIWDGSEISGKTILLHTDEGYGDSIQFIRYAPLVQETGAEVIFACPSPLLRLFSVVKGIDLLIEESAIEEAASPRFHVHAPLLSLPHCFSTTLDSIPREIPYISFPTLKLQFQDSLPTIPNITEATCMKVGIVWASGSRERAKRLNLTGGVHTRDCPLSYFTRLLSVEGVSLFSLQVGEQSSELDSFRNEERIQDLSPLIQDFADTAALINQLDLVISVDTAVAHLAGAMGKLVWTLLPSFPDWRWLQNRSDTSWYPTMRLFRQGRRGDWDSVFAQVLPALRLIRDEKLNPHSDSALHTTVRSAECGF